jgi:uncharacterized membrane protein YphA (DoxX/SURF4 family)
LRILIIDRLKLMSMGRITSLAASIIIGITLVASGTGKLLGDIETPAQVMEFINDVMPEVLLTPAVIFSSTGYWSPGFFP